MPTANKAITYFERGWLLRLVNSSTTPPQHAVVFIHGWTGDEYSMDVFSRDLPESFFLLFPRGPIAAPSGYGWTQSRQGSWPPMRVFEQISRDLMQEIELRLAEVGAGGLPLRLVGFSQGTAVCHTLTVLFPQRIERTAILAGFLPALDQQYDLSQVSGKSFFIAHGLRDETIPFEMARQSVHLLHQAGAVVEFCESNAGHKMALDCSKKLREYITRQAP